MNLEAIAPKKELIVRECSIVNGMLTGFVFLIFFGVFITYLVDDENSIKVYIEPFTISGALGLISLKNTISRRIIMIINSNGIFYGRKLITGWDQFSAAYVTDISNVGSISDRLILVVQYYNASSILVEQRLPLSNTQDKSGNEILQYINAFIQNKPVAV